MGKQVVAMGKLISVIIPVYNVEEYIERCMQSLLSQKYNNFEALIVDDGSPDSSIKRAKAVVGEDPRFVFFEKENGGQGTARNLALDHAKGEYIAFLDSDDYYTPELLYIAAKELDKDLSVDVLSFGINYVDESGALLRQVSRAEEIFNTDNDVLLLDSTLTNFFWDKVFRKNVIADFRFSSIIRTYEDVDLLYQVLYERRIKNIPDCLHNYTQRPGSTSYILTPGYIQDKKNIVLNAKKFLVEKGIYNENEKYYIKYYLIEMFYKPLRQIAMYSENYRCDVNKLLSVANYELLTFKNIYSVKLYYGINIVIHLYSFKISKTLFYFLLRSLTLIRRDRLI